MKVTIFRNQIYAKASKNIYASNKTDVYYIDDTWSVDLLDLNDYGPKNNKSYGYILVVIDNFSKFEWTLPLKNKSAQLSIDSLRTLKHQKENQV